MYVCGEFGGRLKNKRIRGRAKKNGDKIGPKSRFNHHGRKQKVLVPWVRLMFQFFEVYFVILRIVLMVMMEEIRMKMLMKRTQSFIVFSIIILIIIYS